MMGSCRWSVSVSTSKIRLYRNTAVYLSLYAVLLVSFYEFGRHLCLCNKMKGKWCVVDALLIGILSRCIQILLGNYMCIWAKSSNCHVSNYVLNIQMRQKCWFVVEIIPQLMVNCKKNIFYIIKIICHKSLSLSQMPTKAPVVLFRPTVKTQLFSVAFTTLRWCSCTVKTNALTWLERSESWGWFRAILSRYMGTEQDWYN